MPPRADFLRPLIISGPSGAGKSTLLSRLFTEYPDNFGFSVSHTTRSPRPGEVDGKHYYFVSRERFTELINEKAFIEHAQFSGNFYGTSVMTIQNVTSTGKRCILDIDSQGVRQIKQTTDLNPVYLFISPPSLSVLHDRLKGRNTETEISIKVRMDAALREIDYARTPGVHDIIIVNDDLERAFNAFKNVALGDSDSIDALPEFT